MSKKNRRKSNRPKTSNGTADQVQQSHRAPLPMGWFAVIALLIVSGVAVLVLQSPTSAQAAPELEVYKSPTCGCCSAWVNHLTENGFAVKVHNQYDVTPIKQRYGLEPRLRSCHTALVGGYVIEGHVPAADIKRLLEKRPDILGLTVPGMPMGSPGMEGPRRDAYAVLAIGKNGSIQVYSHH